jgi:fluoride exporter
LQACAPNETSPAVDNRALWAQDNPMFTTLSHVALGGAIGAVLRYLTGLALAFPFGTLAVNIVGSFLIGVLWVALAERGHWAPLLVTGVLGGFTTFSAFSLDTLRLVEAGRANMAGLYVLASVMFSLGACALGHWITKGALG